MYILGTVDGNGDNVGNFPPQYSSIKEYHLDSVSNTVQIIDTVNFYSNIRWFTYDYDAPQSGTDRRLDLDRDNIQSAVYRNGSIWCVNSIKINSNDSAHIGILWWQLSPSGVVLQNGLIEDPSGVFSYGYPSIAVNKSDYALIGFTRFSKNSYPSAGYAFRNPSDELNTFQSDFIYKTGADNYIMSDAVLIQRWGDYSSTITDPNGLDFWTLQEFSLAHIPSSTSRCGAWWAKVSDTWDTCNIHASITADPGNNIFNDQSVMFAANANNAGANPVYQWIKNGNFVGSNDRLYTDNALTTGDQIYCVVSSSLGCASGNPATSNTITINVHGPQLYLNLFLEGFYSSVGLMKNGGSGCLNIVDPTSHPDTMDVDTVFVSLMQPGSPFTEVERQPGILKTNGDLFITFSQNVDINESYYLKINHRNSVETWSSAPVFLSQYSAFSITGSDEENNIYGENVALTIDSLSHAIYSGDINQDGAIDATDFLELNVMIINGESGYITGDLNGDGSADGSDFLVLDPNIQNGIGIVVP